MRILWCKIRPGSLIGVFFTLVLSSGWAVSSRAELKPETVLATSTAGQVTYADVAEDWPHLGSEAEKKRIIRDAMKQRIYAREAEQANLDSAPQVKEQLEEARLAASLEALFLREKGEPEISEEALRAYYEAHKDLFYLDEHIYLRHIALDIPSPSDEASRLQTRARALEALRRLEAGDDFAQVCPEYTSDTLYGPHRIGPIPAKDLLAGWGQKVVELKPGQRSEIIELPLRFEIVELLEHHDAGYLPFEQVRPAVRARLLRERRREAQGEFIVEILNALRVDIDHGAIADPETKPGKEVIRADDFRMDKAEYDQWALQQPALTRYALRSPQKREAIVRKNLLLRPWVERAARKQRVEREPAFQTLFERLQRQILSRAFEEYLFARNPSFLEVSDEEIQQYYATHLEEFRSPARAEIRDIIVRADTEPGETPEARALAYRYALEQAKDVIEKLEAGTLTFAIAALKYGSTDAPGDFFRVDQGTQGEEFDELVFALRPGELSPRPIRTDEGYRVVQLGKVIPAVQLPLSEVRGQIVEDLNEEKADRLRNRLQEQYLEQAEARIVESVFLQTPAD